LVKGYSVMVKTVSGDKMPRENPSVARRDFAAKMTVDLSSKFGLSPQDRHRLLAAGAMHFDDETLFGRQVSRGEQAAGAVATPAPAEEQGDQAPAPADHTGSAIGTLAQLDSMPPGAKPN